MLYTPQLELLIMATVGALLLFVGTPVIYGIYCATNEWKELHIERTGTSVVPITEMFKDSPTLSSCVTGLGSTLLFMGIACLLVSRIPMKVQLRARDQGLGLCGVGTASVWVVIATSIADKSPSAKSYYWVHYIAASLFIVTALWMLWLAHDLCTWSIGQLAQHGRGGEGDASTTPSTEADPIVIIRPKRKVLTRDEYTRMSIAAAGIMPCLVLGILGGLVALIGMLGRESTRSYRWYPAIAVGELMVLFMCGVGYSMSAYCYWMIEEFSVNMVI